MNDTKEVNPKDMAASTRLRFSVIPMNVVAEVGLGMTEGTGKYGRHNYRAAGARASVQYDAAMRHLNAWWEGEDIDAKSGLSHITKTITALVVLRDCQMRGIVTDDRPPASAPFMDSFNEISARIIAENTRPDAVHWTNEMYQARETPKTPSPNVDLIPRSRGGFTPD